MTKEFSRDNGNNGFVFPVATRVTDWEKKYGWIWQLPKETH